MQLSDPPQSARLGTMSKPEDFCLLAVGEELSDYTFGSGIMHHLFCKQSGVRRFGGGTLKELGARTTRSRSPASTSRGPWQTVRNARRDAMPISAEARAQHAARPIGGAVRKILPQGGTNS